MRRSLVRGRSVVCRVHGRDDVEVVADGAVYQEDGRILEVGPFAALAGKYEGAEVIGSDAFVVIPGLVNAHHHVGLTPIQLGSLDHALELWFATRISARSVDLYLDTLYSAFEMIESGVTTVQHLHGWRRGTAADLFEAATEVIRAYADVGMRVSYSYAVRDQNRLVYEPDDHFVRRLPEAVAVPLAAHLKAQTVSLKTHLELFEALFERYREAHRTAVQLAPANLHWCSDEALEALADYADRYAVPLHMHLLETPYQKAYAKRRTGGSAVAFLDRFGLLGPHMTLGHGVWLSEADIERIAERGVRLCHNCSSNFRLRSGIAPLNALHQREVRVAIGIDEAGINDDRDMLQEMRMVLKAHREPGMDDRVPTSAQVLRMATEFGAETTPFGDRIGVIEVGRAADLVLVDWRRVAHPYLDPDIGVVDALLHRAKPAAVDTVIVAGEPIYRDRRFTRIDKEAAIAELAASLAGPRSEAEEARRRLARDVAPHVEAFYDGYLADEERDPFYRLNSRR